MPLVARNSANFFFEKLLLNEHKNVSSIKLSLLALALSTTIHATKTLALDQINSLGEKRHISLKKCIECLAPALIFASLYGNGTSLLRSAGYSIIINTVQKN